MTHAHRYATRVAVFAVSLMAVVDAGLAGATNPKGGSQYRGTGQQAFNNTRDGRFANGGFRPRAQISFRVSPDGRRMLNFRGTFFYYCGAGTSAITANFLEVRSDGSFHFAFRSPARGPHGVVDGTVAVVIHGRFTGTGRTARVTYREETRFSKLPASQRPCATQVTGTVRAH